MVRRPPAVELLPLGRGRPRRRGHLLPGWMSPAGGPSYAARSFLHLPQRRSAEGGGPAVAAVEAQVVLRHRPAPEREGARRGREGVAVAVAVVAVVEPGSLLRVRISAL